MIVIRTLSAQAYELMRERILTGELAPGVPLRQDTIALELGVSKIPLREAFSRLEQDGLLSSHPNRGFVVRPLSSAEAEEVFALRLKLEPDATAQASLAATDEERGRANEALTALERLQDEGETVGHVALNRAFHMALVRPGAGLITCQLIERLNIVAERYVHVHLEPEGRNQRAKQEHRQLLALWTAGAAEQVAAATRDHISGTLGDLRKQLWGKVFVSRPYP
ncbi:MAG: GntR family transcriptional regulator [Caulobacteraceae bacterium]